MSPAGTFTLSRTEESWLYFLSTDMSPDCLHKHTASPAPHKWTTSARCGTNQQAGHDLPKLLPRLPTNFQCRQNLASAGKGGNAPALQALQRRPAVSHGMPPRKVTATHRATAQPLLCGALSWPAAIVSTTQKVATASLC